MKKLYLFFRDEITCLLYFTKNLDFFMGLIFLRIFEEKVKKNHVKWKNYFKKSENFTMCVYYNKKNIIV